jgi:hypothetical protein
VPPSSRSEMRYVSRPTRLHVCHKINDECLHQMPQSARRVCTLAMHRVVEGIGSYGVNWYLGHWAVNYQNHAPALSLADKGFRYLDDRISSMPQRGRGRAEEMSLRVPRNRYQPSSP